ncbi:GAF domain-containing protein [Mycobacterium sp. NPDC050551]|uniref:sensor histidine kinase n=1 Tax=Mycobacterium sp. NPDC050551 TaxID=3155407 RepID=UPI00342FCCDB
MHEQLDELVADRAEMAHLVDVVLEIGSELDLDATLEHIVRAAKVMTGGRYGAIGVWGADEILSAFVHDGIGEPSAQAVRESPVSKGLFGLLHNPSEPLRVADLATDPAAAGLPEKHPLMRSFLGMPIAIRGEQFGALYVADERPGHEFTASDELAVRALASAAAVAIDNARLFDQTRAAARWTSASREIMAALLSDADPDMRPLRVIASRAMELADAEQAIVLIPGDPEQPAADVDTLVVSAAVGRCSNEVLGKAVPVEGSTTGAVFRSGKPFITETFRRPIEAFTDVGGRPAIVVPLRSEQRALGVLIVARSAGAPRFDDSYLELVRDFGDHAAIALTVAGARHFTAEMAMVADRERIAHDLHDQVIQRVFAVGMDLQGVVARVRDRDLAARVTRSVDELRAVVTDIRSTIFDLQHPNEAHGGFAKRVHETFARLTEDREVAATLVLSGPVTVIHPSLADQAEAVLVEALSNAVRHSGARSIAVEVTVDDVLTLDISDDGCGIAHGTPRRSGLANLASRAQELGGDFTVTDLSAGGTRLIWCAPLVALDPSPAGW